MTDRAGAHRCGNAAPALGGFDEAALAKERNRDRDLRERCIDGLPHFFVSERCTNESVDLQRHLLEHVFVACVLVWRAALGRSMLPPE